MRRILTTLLFASLLAAGTQAQTLDPTDYIYPIRNVDGSCSANFGEMRPGHFHAGVDIRTGGAEGKPLVAVADGYVSRLYLSSGGYGRAIYIALANGTTAVYGHMQCFRDDIEEYVRNERYARRANRLDLYFTPDVWPVRQGDIIGYSGNSGSSMGPHLHFEVRDTPTQRLYNPVHEGIIRPTDTLPPRIFRLHYVEVDTLPGTDLCLRSTPCTHQTKVERPGHYRLQRTEPVEVGRKGYFVAEVSDRRNGVNNTFGIWRLTAWVDDERVFEYRMDGFTFDLSRCCDAISCYPLQIASRNECIRLAQLATAPDCFYSAMTERGILRTEPGQIRHIRIEAEDDSGNISHLHFDVRGRTGQFRAEADSTAKIVRPDTPTTISSGPGMRARIPAGAVYETIYCRPEQLPAPQADSGIVVLSPAYRILPATIPLRRAATISIRADVPHHLQLRASLAKKSAKGRVTYIGGHYADGAVTARTTSTDGLFVVADTLPPRITPLFKSGADLSKTPELRFRVSDNFSGIASASLVIDGAWVPCDRYPMQSRLIHRFDTPACGRKHTVHLTLRDGAGNTTHWEGSFYR